MSTSRPRVYARIRPQNENESAKGGTVVLRSEPQQKDTLVFDKDGEQVKTRFDHVFDPDTTQPQVFAHISTEVMSTLFSGYNASIFAYGQTGSGKTHTMEGNQQMVEGAGVIPRLIAAIFERFASNPDIDNASLSASFVQIYQEKIQDLLNQRKQLEIHMDRTGQYIAQNATWHTVRNTDETLHMYHEALKMRSTSATEMNAVSSRSHTILMLKLFWDEPHLPGSRAQLNLIDLAGSEKLNQSGATGETMREAIHINKSLSALGNVVSKLVDQVKHKDRRIHVPYKDSKLTYLLQSSLGGSNLVHFIIALSASSLWKPESQASIEFGKRALQLVIRPVRNPIDYKRLEEMEAMIEKMRNHIQSLEEELRTKPQGAGGEDPGFLQLKQLHQEGEERKKRALAHRKSANQKSALKTKTELNRIIQNLPETLEDLTSHCVLNPQSKADFRVLDGIQKLVYFVDKNPSTFYRAHAAHTIASVIDDEGREILGACGGIEALGRLLQVNEERCKEAACIGLETVVRNFPKNKARITTDVYEFLVSLVHKNKNQQVQEAACTCLASIVDNYPPAKKILTPMNIVKKLMDTIRGAPAEIVHVTKAATTCIGRLAHGDADQQRAIAGENGINVLIDDVLFSPVGDRDHQLPILASYALVNLCCSNVENMAIARRHPEFEEVRFRLMEGLARAFGNNTTREGFGRATAEENSSPFPYHGVTVTDKWDPLNCGGRPIFSTFMENPQYFLYINEDTKLTVLIQDTLYEMRMQQKQRNNTVYMGLAIFEADPELTKAGLKQLDFHGKLLEIAKFTSNCENVLNCTLKASETPYILVPFTSQRGRATNFALSAFGDKRLDLTPVPESAGWVRSLIDGNWNSMTGQGGDNYAWRCNSQVRVVARENCRVVFVLSYKSLDDMRKGNQQQVVEEGDEERHNTRPRLHGRLFTHTFAPEKRYVKALVPLPQGSTFVASNAFSSNSYITTAASLKAGQTYCYIPYTDTSVDDTWRLRVFCDSDALDVEPIAGRDQEWNTTILSGNWTGSPLTISIQGQERMTAVVASKETFVRLSIADGRGQKVNGIDSFWNGEANVEHVIDSGTIGLVVEGMVRSNGGQTTAKGNPFDLILFSEAPLTILDSSYKPRDGTHDGIVIPGNNVKESLLDYPMIAADVEESAIIQDNFEELDDDDDDEDEVGGDAGAMLEATKRAEDLQSELTRKEDQMRQLQQQLRDRDAEIEELKTQLLQAGGSGGGSNSALNGGARMQPPPGRAPTGPGARADSRTGRRGLGSATGAPSNGRLAQQPPPPNIHLAPDRDRAVNDVVLKLNSLAQTERPPNQGDWNKLKREIKDCQTKLVMSSMN